MLYKGYKYICTCQYNLSFWCFLPIKIPPQIPSGQAGGVQKSGQQVDMLNTVSPLFTASQVLVWDFWTIKTSRVWRANCLDEVVEWRLKKIHLSRRVLMILLTFELEVWKRKGVLMWVWSGLPPKQDILEMDTVVLWGIDGIWYPIFETFNQMSWKKVNDLLWSLHCPKCCFCLRIEHRPHETAHNGGWYARCWARVGGWRSLRLHTCWMLARCSVGVGGMITFLALAHIGKVNLLKPSAAAVETCKYIQVRLMGSGASWKMPFLINWWRKNARKKLRLVLACGHMSAWQWRWEVSQTGNACMKETGIKLSQMAKMWNVVVLKHEATAKLRKIVFCSFISNTQFKQVSL